MTMNYERRNAVNRTRNFLVEILQYPAGVPDELWQEARACLKHFPGEYDMRIAAEQSPEIFGDFTWYKENHQ